MERIMRIALLSLMGAAAFKVAYVTLCVDRASEPEMTGRQGFVVRETAREPRDEWHRD